MHARIHSGVPPSSQRQSEIGGSDLLVSDEQKHWEMAARTRSSKAEGFKGVFLRQTGRGLQ
jgi:hypothetical protein